MLEVELIVDYLVENSYASTTTNAYNLISCMSDRWISSILEEVLTEEPSLYNLISEMRKEDKVRGAKKTPLYVGTKIVPGKVEQYRETPDGKLITRVTPASVKKVPNRDVMLARFKQGMPNIPKKDDPNNMIRDISQYYTMPGQTRHPHGGAEPGGVPKGRLRGVKKQKGVKRQVNHENTPVGQFKIKRQIAADIKNRPYRYTNI